MIVCVAFAVAFAVAVAVALITYCTRTRTYCGQGLVCAMIRLILFFVTFWLFPCPKMSWHSQKYLASRILRTNAILNIYAPMNIPSTICSPMSNAVNKSFNKKVPSVVLFLFSVLCAIVIIMTVRVPVHTHNNITVLIIIGKHGTSTRT